MANRRMFSNRIANSARFLQMPAESQVLYFHMVLRADDDGVVESYPLIKLLGVPSDNFKVLEAKGFIRQLNADQVVVITDWLEHNAIRADRKVNSIYSHLLEEVAPDVPRVEAKPRSDVTDNSKRVGGPSTDGIGKVRLGKVRLGKVNTYMADFEKFWFEYPKKIARKKAEQVYTRLQPNLDAVLSGLAKWKQTDQWKKDNGQFIPHPATWLHQERWNDEVEVKNTKTQKYDRFN